MTLGIVGLGQRGSIYADFARENGASIEYVVDTNPEVLQHAQKKYGIPSEHCFTDSGSFFALGKVTDALIIATQDQSHYRLTMNALDLRYPLLLEKPVSNDPIECLNIREKAECAQVPVTVCHVLRYSPFFAKIKEIVDSNVIGKIITIQHNENIGNFHIAHSYVRGNWRKAKDSSPLILAKSCHDLDILIWLTGSNPERVASFGSLTYFKKENAPEGSGERCLNCAISETCRYDARKCYLPIAGNWPATVVSKDQSEEGILSALENGPYGRCVFRCDNDVCDHQVSIIQFENGVTATFNLSGMTDRNCRTLKIMCESGEIRANMDLNIIEVIEFSSNYMSERHVHVYHPEETSSGHGGGDYKLMKAFLHSLKNDNTMSSSIQNSIASHVLAFAAEKARVNNCVITISEFEKDFVENN